MAGMRGLIFDHHLSYKKRSSELQVSASLGSKYVQALPSACFFAFFNGRRMEDERKYGESFSFPTGFTPLFLHIPHFGL